jgi:hypothetical protein
MTRAYSHPLKIERYLARYGFSRTTLTLGDYHPTSNADEAGSAKLSQFARRGIDDR